MCWWGYFCILLLFYYSVYKYTWFLINKATQQQPISQIIQTCKDAQIKLLDNKPDISHHYLFTSTVYTKNAGACLFVSPVASHLSFTGWHLCTDVMAVFALLSGCTICTLFPGNVKHSRKLFNKHRWGILRWRYVNRQRKWEGSSP